LRRNCLLKNITEGKIEGRKGVTVRRRRRRKHLLDDLKETTEYCKLKAGAMACTVWKTSFGIGCGTVFRQTIE
jgi:hypothetical protein